MKKVPAILIALVSIPFISFGVLFLIASSHQASRALVGVVLLAIGVAILVAGIKWLRRLAALSPETLRTSAVDLARRLGGELTVAQLRAEYRIPQDMADEVIEGLLHEGICVPQQREIRTVYVFTGLLPSLAEKVCPYCGTELPVRASLRKCPNCGAQLEIQKT